VFAASTTSRAIFLVFAICLIGSKATYAQDASFLSRSRPIGSGRVSETWPSNCVVLPKHMTGVARFSEGDDWQLIATPGDASLFGAPGTECVDSAFSAALARPRKDDSCRADVPWTPSAPNALPCKLSADAIPAQLSALGKLGAKIARAREEVLDILRSENACSEWFATKDRAPAETFRSLNFLLDSQGPQDITASMVDPTLLLMHQPYVASATQDGGAYTAITINVYGAFYRSQGQIRKTASEGGPAQLEGTGVLRVGAYTGDTLAAQVVTLLHEFGHIVDLLPEDADNLDGKSVRNTDEVLRHCRVEIEARTKHTTSH
jgi:hypothetical protein